MDHMLGLSNHRQGCYPPPKRWLRAKHGNILIFLEPVAPEFGPPWRRLGCLSTAPARTPPGEQDSSQAVPLRLQCHRTRAFRSVVGTLRCRLQTMRCSACACGGCGPALHPGTLVGGLQLGTGQGRGF